MYKIGDFSQLGQVSARMLRHYDKLGLLKPGHIDRFTGYRYYTLEQFPRLNRIIALKDLGFSLDEIGKLLEEDLSQEAILLLLEKRKREIEKGLKEESERLKRVALRMRQIKTEKNPVKHDVSIKTLSRQKIVGLRQNVTHIDQMSTFRGRAIESTYNWIRTAGIPYGIETVIYFNDEYTDENVDMLLGVHINPNLRVSPPDPLVNVTLEASETAASIVHHGSIRDIPQIVSGLYGWIGLNGYFSAGPYREIHHFGEELEVFQQGRQDDVVFEIVLPITKF